MMLQSTVERSKGGMTWNDVISTIEQIRRAKMLEQLGSTLADLSVADLTVALEIAAAEAAPKPLMVPAPAPIPRSAKKKK
jgi:hypothetical protein